MPKMTRHLCLTLQAEGCMWLALPLLHANCQLWQKHDYHRSCLCMQQQSIKSCRSRYQWMWGSSARPCGASDEAKTLLLSEGTQSLQLTRRLDHTHLHHSHPAQVSLLFDIMHARKQDWAVSTGLMRGRDGARGIVACYLEDRI